MAWFLYFDSWLIFKWVVCFWIIMYLKIYLGHSYSWITAWLCIAMWVEIFSPPSTVFLTLLFSAICCCSETVWEFCGFCCYHCSFIVTYVNSWRQVRFSNLILYAKFCFLSVQLCLGDSSTFRLKKNGDSVFDFLFVFTVMPFVLFCYFAFVVHIFSSSRIPFLY